jgi:cytochrome b561
MRKIDKNQSIGLFATSDHITFFLLTSILPYSHAIVINMDKGHEAYFFFLQFFPPSFLPSFFSSEIMESIYVSLTDGQIVPAS